MSGLAPALLRVVSLACAASLFACERHEPPPELMPIAPFALIDQRGEPFGTEQLRGKVWIADVIFTSCPGVCPTLTSQMANLSRRLPARDDLRFVSVTVDPEVDTPERLREYAARFGADPARWSFLTGEREAVHHAIERSLRLPVGDREPAGEGYDILHASRFLLVDQRGVLRGTYSTDAEGLGELERDARMLLDP
ncbi:MAG: SCO family protein [Sandaracinaceae bacterium]|nr:SCO family protein [Sandaracinaceae bacterium]